MRRITLGLVAMLALIVPPSPGSGAVPQACPGEDGSPTSVVTGVFPRSMQGSYVIVPFDVPAGSTRVRVKICYDQPDIPVSAGPYSAKHTLDLGIYDTRGANGFFDGDGFRGWGGSSRPNVLITPEDSTTVGFKPGPIVAGEWAAEIGVAAVGGITEGDLDQSVAWRLEIFVASLATDLDEPWTPAAYDETPANPNAGWYAGDMHVHAEHSSPNDATMVETFDYAFDEAGLDFLTMSDYVTDRHWDEIGRLQADHPGKLVIRSAEVITYRGHINNHASLRYVDYRSGPIVERRTDGTFLQVRGAQPASRIFDDIHAGPGTDALGGWAQVNHPTIFPGQVPAFANFCRGCSWSYSDAETDWSKVDAFEVQTGPAGTTGPKGNELGPNPFTVLAIAWYDHLRLEGFDITAVGSSDSHRAGNVNPALPDPLGEIVPLSLQSPVGEATTVVYADELSERGIRDGVLAGHAYVKFFGPDGPDLRFTASPVAGGPQVMMGDTLTGSPARFTASVLNAPPSIHPRVLLVIRNGLPYLAVPIVGTNQTIRFTGAIGGDYRLQLMRGTAFEAMSNPITLATRAA